MGVGVFGADRLNRKHANLHLTVDFSERGNNNYVMNSMTKLLKTTVYVCISETQQQYPQIPVRCHGEMHSGSLRIS